MVTQTVKRLSAPGRLGQESIYRKAGERAKIAGTTMILTQRIKRNWSLFASSRPGHRFRERYRLHRSGRRRGFDPVRLLYIAGGLFLIFASALFGWLPVLGWGTVFLGLGIIAGESYPVAQMMDRLEVRARKLFGPLGRRLARLPAWAQLSISVTIALITFALMYDLYSSAFGS